AIKKADPVFGNYVGGHINMALDVLSSGLSVDVAAVFGNAGYRYWFVNGEVDLGAGISVGAVKITGFSGGAYYRMQPTGDKGLAAFKPDKGISLGFRAGVSLAIASKEAVSAKAIYEMNFNASGGINTILFYGQAAFMTDLTPLQDKLAPIRNFYNGVQKTFKAADKSLSDQIKAQSDSELVQKLIGKVSANTNLPPLSNSGVITAYVRIEYEAETKTFDANFSINLSVPGNFIRGEGNNGAALWANLHISPATWYIRIGTPTNPIGIAIGIKGLPSIHSDAYFMLGDDILPPAPLPDLVRNKLGGDIDQHPYSDNLMSIGSGIGFGARFGFDTGDLTFLILYCRFQAEMGFDFTLTDMSGYACEGSTKQIGMNGWRAEGRCYAALDGDLGVKLNLLFIHKKISVIHGGVAAALEAKLPNPTWIGGALGIDLNILGLIKAKMSMKFSFGENCKLVRLDGTVPPLDFSLISDASPTDGSTDVDVFTSPQVTFAKAVNASFSLYNEDANGNKTYEDEGKKSYRIRLGNCYLENLSNGQELPLDKPLNQLLSNDKLALTLKTRDILPSHTKIQLSVTVYLEELQANGWTAVDGGTETKTLTFTSGEQPDHIPLENVLSSYPLINQQNFYRSEGKVNGSIRGYIALSYGQPDLFANNFDKKVRFTANGSTRSVDFHYNAANKSVEYEIPALSGNCAYTVDFGLYGKASSNTGGLQQTSYTQSYDNGQGETFDVEFIKNLAQKVLASGSKSIFNYGFHSSRYSTFAGKINGLALETGNDNIFGMTDVRRLLLFSSKAIDEPFDLAEVVGNSYTYGKPLVSIEALMTDKYYTEDIAPLIYEPLPSYQFTRDIARQLGIAYLRIPSNAFVLYEGYVDALNNGNTPSRYGIFPYVHVLQRMYYADFYELKDQLSPYGRLAQQREKFKKLWSTGAFPFYREGRIYPAQLIYRLPDGREGSAVKVKYEWRWKY
ncbi:MAG: hypothetical protein LBL81_06210, partial [Tannerella sp.]|nr:hypothetical protein [Tannerella sp.]